MTLKEDSRILKSGTNEFKLIEFHIGAMKLGINLIKVKKLIAFREEKLTRMLEVPEGVMGILEVDDGVIHVIDLRQLFDAEGNTENSERVILITEFNKNRYGFVVDHIHAVHRISWERLQPVDNICPSEMILAVASLGSEDIMMVDFEMIIDKIFPESIGMPIDESSPEEDIVELRKKAVIIAADDSKVIRKKLSYIFSKHQFENVTLCADGKEAYDLFVSKNTGNDIDPFFTFMVTDIEMPQMDGLTLCRRVKEMAPHLPVLILSSLISNQFLAKCREVNADIGLSKNDLDSLVKEIDKLLLAQKNNQV